ncbi:MAG: 1-acyl-sn-glycerol-3-phosphate acyltransferase [Gammaproteobacteria bacterium]|nr:1-acyl-sn-glycerol-3-phosphate acyltransferase [Gammaproteobacteria bacterium]
MEKTTPDRGEQRDEFSAIRPHGDHEIRPVLDRLIADREFLDTLAAFHSPRLARWLPWALRLATARRLRDLAAPVRDVDSMQQIVARYMDQTVRESTWGLGVAGLEKLTPGRGYLFVSNHRDIVMDPAFTNLLLYRGGFSTLKIGVGDNLLKRPWVADLMRANKSFVVHRSLRGRERLLASKRLSEYIHHCVGGGENVWIAQREGRAKDGIDRTDPALLKMLAMAARNEPPRARLAKLHIVPVAISYEFDPCDEIKARERRAVETSGAYTRTEASDLRSIAAGMTGFKGRVHVAFGEELQCESDEVEALAREMDRQVIRNYRLFETNYRALEILRDGGEALPPGATGVLAGREVDHRSRERFDRRLADIDVELRKLWLYGYANPVISRHASAAGAN